MLAKRTGMFGLNVDSLNLNKTYTQNCWLRSEQYSPIGGKSPQQ